MRSVARCCSTVKGNSRLNVLSLRCVQLLRGRMAGWQDKHACRIVSGVLACKQLQKRHHLVIAFIGRCHMLGAGAPPHHSRLVMCVSLLAARRCGPV